MQASRKLLPVAAILGLLACSMTRQAESQTAGSGGPCANFYTSGFQLPQGQVDAAVPYVARPVKGAITRDPVFGTCVVRATAHDSEVQRAFERNDYSRREPFNADMSYFFVYSDGGFWQLYDTNTLKYIKVLNGPAGDAELQWDPTDPKKLYFTPTNGGLKLYALNVDTGAITTVADFTGKLPWPNAAHVWTKSEGSPSRDGRYWGLMVDDANFNSLGLIVWDTVQNKLVGSMNTNGKRPDHISMSPSGRWVVPSWLDGTYAYSPDFRKRVQLHHSSEHSDIGVLPNGDDVYVSIDFQSNDGSIFMVDLDTGVRTDLLPTYIGGSATALHVSMKAYNKPGWALIGTYAGTGPHRWYMDHLFALELKANPRIYNIAFHHSNDGGYWAEPQAAVNRDFTRILFNSNWGTTSGTDVDAYMVQLPAGAIPSAGSSGAGTSGGTPPPAGRHDMTGVYQPSTRTFILRKDDGSTTSFVYGALGDVPLMGDWNGDGTTTAGVYRPVTSTFYLHNANAGGAADIAIRYGRPGDVPMVGDWTGSGKTSIGLYRPSNNTFYLLTSLGSDWQTLTIPFGMSGIEALGADWQGRGASNVVAYDPIRRSFYLLNTNQSGAIGKSFVYGAVGDLPLMGDWDGDGVATVGVYRPSTGYFYLKNSNAGGSADISVKFGSSADIPLVGRW